jgi:hypothetical protein
VECPLDGAMETAVKINFCKWSSMLAQACSKLCSRAT